MNPPCEMSTEHDGELAVNFGLVNLGFPDSLATEHQTLTQKVWGSISSWRKKTL